MPSHQRAIAGAASRLAGSETSGARGTPSAASCRASRRTTSPPRRHRRGGHAKAAARWRPASSARRCDGKEVAVASPDRRRHAGEAARVTAAPAAARTSGGQGRRGRRPSSRRPSPRALDRRPGAGGERNGARSARSALQAASCPGGSAEGEQRQRGAPTAERRSSLRRQHVRETRRAELVPGARRAPRPARAPSRAAAPPAAVAARQRAPLRPAADRVDDAADLTPRQAGPRRCVDRSWPPLARRTERPEPPSAPPPAPAPQSHLPGHTVASPDPHHLLAVPLSAAVPAIPPGAPPGA